jgi:hypothetical protein
MPIKTVEVTQHTYDQRERKSCNWCGMRRLCTRITLHFTSTGRKSTAWACNECLTSMTPGLNAE